MKAADHKKVAVEIVDSIGAGASFDDVKDRLAGELAKTYEAGQKSLEGVDATQLGGSPALRRTIALESIAADVSVIRGQVAGEAMDTHQVRDVLIRCAEVLRFPRRTADAELQNAIQEILRGPGS